MRRFNVVLLLVLMLVACSNSEEEITGEITKIEAGMVYIDESPLKVKDTSQLEVVQNVKVTYIDKTATDDWDPNDFEVKNIEIME
ncbi:hypothetical protein SAMN04487936_1112 [Halobacillus dabanensis]|uniref:DUF3221 domain-containing protein n=1 Tax=Halobacillus dabanensis TaxID=240302 RepID=A0A1I3YGQ8_HALDA|nr:hypothetical protein [Halobacillus dabanensis]SFK30975.1 hypothetical protein SAMN04487936_1112 [Halobacillus dabanensis]